MILKSGNVLGIFLLFTLSSPTWSQEMSFTDSQMSACYSRAMVGMDSVINSRLHVVAEHALFLSHIPGTQKNTESGYDHDYLVIILDAYLWSRSPHDYALKVFYDCATQQTPVFNAGR